MISFIPNRIFLLYYSNLKTHGINRSRGKLRVAINDEEKHPKVFQKLIGK